MSLFRSALRTGNEILHGGLSLFHIASPFPIIMVTWIELTHDSAQRVKSLHIWILVALIVSSIVNIILFFRVRSSKKAKRYKEIYSQLNSAFHTIHMTEWKNADESSSTLGVFCSNLSQVLEHVTQKKCYVTIKKMYVKAAGEHDTQGEMFVFTVARDSVSATIRTNERTIRHPHPVAQNTDFSDVLDKVKKGIPQKWFFSNNLLKTVNYHNSSWQYYNKGHDCLDNLKKRQKKKEWDLDYKSTIIAPICKYAQSHDAHGTLVITSHVQGFVCIHASETDVFEETDCHIAVGCADALVDILNVLPFKEKP